ncbi:hypothetical protein ACLMJK_002941 [Lecanora helva]
MDPILDTIPEDYAYDIKDLVRKRDESSKLGGEERPAKRARAGTLALLGEEHGEGDPPHPELEIQAYTKERLRSGLRYLHKAAQRKITPRTKEYLRLHRDAYKVALEGDRPEHEAKAVVQALDNVYFSESFYFKPRSGEEQSRLERYIQFRRLQLLANYGDYLGYTLQQVRAELKKAAKQNDDPAIQHAATQLGSKQSGFEIADKLKGEDVKDLQRHVLIACDTLGIDHHYMCWLIEEWAERNRTFHNFCREYIRDCRWADLAAQLCRDLNELINVAPDQETASNYENVMISMRDEFYRVRVEKDPQGWFPNDNAETLTVKLIAMQKKVKT